MNTELIVVILLIVCVIICQAVDGIQMRHIEDKIDELKEEIKVLENKKDETITQMKKIKLNEETIKKFKEALDVFMVNPKKGNAMLDKIHEEQQDDDAETFIVHIIKNKD